jgi:hypothetical protein
MQKPINYLDLFTFELYQPIAVLEGKDTLEQVEKELMKNEIFSLSYITDRNNPVFIATEKHLKISGVKQNLLLIILPFVYTKEYNT